MSDPPYDSLDDYTKSVLFEEWEVLKGMRSMQFTIRMSSPNSYRRVLNPPMELNVRIIARDKSGKVVPPEIRNRWQVEWLMHDEAGRPLKVDPRASSIIFDSYVRTPIRRAGWIVVNVRVRENASSPWVSACARWSVPDVNGSGQKPCAEDGGRRQQGSHLDP